MKSKMLKFCPAYGVLFTTVISCAGFSYWIMSKTEMEKAHNFYVDYRRLLLKGEHKQAIELHQNTLSVGGDEALDEAWLPLVQAQVDGYDKLYHYRRILAGNTQREETYEEIAELIKRSPQSFQQEVKISYLKLLNEITDVRGDLLEKYGLKVE